MITQILPGAGVKAVYRGDNGKEFSEGVLLLALVETRRGRSHIEVLDIGEGKIRRVRDYSNFLRLEKD